VYSSFVFYLPEDGHVFGRNMKVTVYVNQFGYTYVHCVGTTTTLYVHCVGTTTTLYDTFLVTLTITIAFFFPILSYLYISLLIADYGTMDCRKNRGPYCTQEAHQIQWAPEEIENRRGNSTISKQYPKWTLSDRQCWSVCYILNENYIT
jgi:hypothetical protein